MRLTLKTTLIGVVSALVVLIGAQALLANSKSESLNANAEDLATSWLPSVKVLGEIKYLATRVRLFESRIVLNPDTSQRAETIRRLDDAIAGMSKRFQTYQPLISSPDEKRIWDVFIDKWNAYLTVEKQVMNMVALNKTG